MMDVASSDVSSLVRSINSCFEDAAGLVRRIRDRGGSNEAAINELIDSLEFGPLVINGYFTSDSKRFGPSYASGDHYAQEQLRNVLFHLEMNVLTTLSSVLFDDKKLDYIAVQASSDDCRVNAGVSLGQLSQRLANPSRSQEYSSHITSFPFTLPMPTLKHSQSMSSNNSEGPRTPTTPELEAAMADLDYPGRLPGFITPPSDQGKAFAVLQGSPSPHRKSAAISSYSSDWTPDRRSNSIAETARSQPPSVHSVSAVISPVSPPSSHDQWGRPPPATANAPNTWSPVEERTTEPPRERYGPDDYEDVKSAHYQIKPVRRRPAPIEVPQVRERQYSVTSQATTSDVSGDLPPTSRMMTSRRSTSSSIPVQLHTARSNASMHAPIPVDEDAPPLPTPPLPSKSPAREPLRPGARKILGIDDPYIERFVNEPVMPNENNTMGYCKGAFKMQIGLEKKAFDVSQRPAGMMGFVKYWQCKHCTFEGPIRFITQPGKKQAKIFDPAIREFDGIRFKWSFLAKCHVPMKSHSGAVGTSDGSTGSFGCIFCTAEAKARHWNIASMSSVGKGKNAQRPASSDATPIFGNSVSFMEHLQFHRQMNYWPNREMQRKMKCVVGRVAEVGEDYEINFMPLEVEMEA